MIGSVAKPLWKDIPRFQEFRRTRDIALRDAYADGIGPSVAGHQVEIFLFEPGSDHYLGRLCNFNACPKGKPDCAVPGCGAIPFNKLVDGFVPTVDLLAPAAHAMLYRRGQGRLMSALDLPQAEPLRTER